jgi:hypothetical protein
MADRLLGWWLFDAESSAVRHETTGQVLRFLGHPLLSDFGLTQSQNRLWRVFEYRDREVHLPILVEWRNVPSAVRGRPLVWRVDYVRSSDLWRRKRDIGSAHTAYGLWRRVDECLTDALASWPEHPKTGPKPKYISLEGGWLNGAWTNELYRCVWCSVRLRESTEVFQSPSLPPLVCDAPSPWVQGEPGTEEEPATWNIPDSEVRSEVQAALRRRHYLVAADRSRLLVALPKSEIRMSAKRISRLLYADKDIVTDALHIGVYDARRTELPTWIASFAKNAPLGLLSRVTGERIPWAGSYFQSPSGETLRVDHMPHAALRQVGHAIVDACLAYPDAEWMPAADPAATEEVSLPPGIVNISGWELGGCGMPSQLEAAKSLESRKDQSNQLAYMFGQHDGIVRSETPFDTEGYWRFDPSTQSLCNSISRQRVTLQANLEPKPDFHRTWRFQYEDDDVRYPIVVRSRITPSNGTLQTDWIIDHDQSLLLWRQIEGNGEIPAFGLWQRVNECVVDALLSWPEVDPTGPKPVWVFSIAGWFNGSWSSRIRRRSQRGYDHGFTKDAAPLTPFLGEMTAPSYRWTFVDSPRAVRGARLANVEERGPGQLYLAPNERLTGFEADVPYLIRSDGGAVMFPAGLNSYLHRGEDYMPGAYFCYADADMFFFINGGEFAGLGNLPSSWTFNLAYPFEIGLRHLEWFDASRPGGISTDLFVRRQNYFGSAHSFASPSGWQRVATALIDGWLSWIGSPNRMLDDPSQLEKLRNRDAYLPDPDKSGIALGRRTQVRIEGGYLAGRFNTMHSTTAWLEE